MQLYATTTTTNMQFAEGDDVVKPRRTLQNVRSLEMDEKRVKAIIFDLDNTLIETRWAGEVAIQKVIM